MKNKIIEKCNLLVVFLMQSCKVVVKYVYLACRFIKLAIYALYNSFPLFARKCIDAVFVVSYMFLLRKINSTKSYITKDRPNLKRFSKIHLMVNLVALAVCCVMGLSFYFDGIHEKSGWLSLTTLYRPEFIFLSLFLTSCIYYGKHNFNLEEKKKGGANGSYYKK